MANYHTSNNRTENCIFGQLNASTISKHSEVVINKFMADHNIQLLAAQETGTWDPSPSLFTNHRIFQNKGPNDPARAGVALIINKALAPEHIGDLKDTNIDAVWAQIKLNGRRILVGSVYCRPTDGSNLLNDLLKHMEKVLVYKQKHGYTSFMVYGDFNARHAEWGDHKTGVRGKSLKEFCEQNTLSVCSPFEQTFVCNTGGSVIDLLLVQGHICSKINSQWIEKRTELFTGAPRRGHYPVLHSVQSTGTTDNVKETKVNWKEADWDSWKDQVEEKLDSWLSDHPNSGGEDLWKILLEIIQQAIHDHIPTKIISIHSQPFWNHTLSSFSKEARDARSRFQNRSTPHNREELNEVLKHFRLALTSAKNNWIREKTESINLKECQQFWKNYKGVFGINPDKYICNLEDNDVLHTTDEEKEKVLYDTFFTGKHLQGQQTNQQHESTVMSQYNKITEKLHAQYSQEASTPVQEEESDRNNMDKDVEITEIEAAISKQEATDKAIDDDGIHPIILKKLGATAKIILQKIFNECLSTGSWLWKDSFVIFIRKADKKSYTKPGDYRPITISSYFGKVFERISDNRARIWLQSSGQIDVDQEGFLSSRSTTRYLFRLLANLNEIKRKKLSCIILFIDFAKAFDSVHIPTLIVKLEKMGFGMKMLGVIKTYLEDRAIRLKVNKFTGRSRRCGLFGLPQGSALAPLLFIIYIADLINTVPTRVKEIMGMFKFADDGTVVISAPNMVICHELMQIFCNHLHRWCVMNKLVPNCDVNKTEAMVLQTGNTAYGSDLIPPLLSIGGKIIQYVHQTKALGVIIDDKLTFKEHAESKLKVCNQSWGNLTKSTNRNHGLNVRSLTLLLKTVVLTKLHYASPLWLYNNIETFRDFWNKVIMKTTGSMLNPHREVTELALHLPPLAVQLHLLTTKFLCKCLTAGDHISSIVLQVEGSQSQFQPQINCLKEFVAWKKGLRTARGIELSQSDSITEAYYSKSEMERYQTFIWINRVKSQCQVRNRPSQMDFSLLEMIQADDITNYQFNGRNFLFSHNTTKGLDSFIMDYIHGNSLIFGNVRASVQRTAVPTVCYFCNTEVDSAQHQLEYCTEVKDHTHEELLLQLNTPSASGNLLKDLIFPLDDRIQLAFINRIAFLKDQHNYLIEEEEDEE